MVTKVSELSRQTVSYPKVEDLKITNDNYRRCRRLFPREDVTLVYKVKEGDIPLYIEPTDSWNPKSRTLGTRKVPCDVPSFFNLLLRQ